MKAAPVLAVLVTALVAASCGPEESHPTQKEPETVAAELATVRKSSFPVTYDAVGTVRPKLESSLSAKIMARVTSVSVREGDAVRAGQTLVVLDARDLDASVAVAGAQAHAARVGVGNARTAARMEEQAGLARVTQAEAAVAQAKAGVGLAESRLALALAGPRPQERVQADLAVQQAESNLRRAESDWQRAKRLVDAGALAAKNEETARNALEVARAQHQTALEARKISQEGTRAEDVRTAREAVAQARAGVRVAEANLKEARAALLQTEVRREEIKAAQAQVAQSAAGLQMARVSRSYATVVAPFDGVVAARSVDPGAVAGPGVPLLTVQDKVMRLEVTVPESVLASVQVGDPVAVTLDALGGSLQGKVVEIVPRGASDSHTFAVRVDLPASSGAKSGMFGRASFTTGAKRALLVPASAFWEREGLNYAYASNPEGLVRLRIVTLGERRGEMVEVLSGLKEGERVVLKPTDEVRDGMKVVSR